MALLTEETVFNTVCERLETAACLGYIKKVFRGERQVEHLKELPCIIVDDAGDIEEFVEQPRRRRITISLIIKAVLNVSEQLDNQIVGNSANQPGVYRVRNDIKKALEGSDFRMSNDVSYYNLESLPSELRNNITREIPIRLDLQLKYFDAENRD